MALVELGADIEYSQSRSAQSDVSSPLEFARSLAGADTGSVAEEGATGQAQGNVTSGSVSASAQIVQLLEEALAERERKITTNEERCFTSSAVILRCCCCDRASTHTFLTDENQRPTHT